MNLACQSCKKQPATVHLTDISQEGEKRERHLCEHCAHEEGVVPKPVASTPITEIIGGLVVQKAAIQQLADLCCPHCKMTFIEFRNSGVLGCPADYEVFEKALLPLIERAHEGASHHLGKAPRRLGVRRGGENDLLRLRGELNRLVDGENYEEAARIRDRIRTMEQG